MVRLLGPQDRFLSTIEKQYPAVSVHVRGNQITLDRTGQVRGGREPLVEELVQMVRGGHDLGPGRCETSGADPRAIAGRARPSCSARRSSPAGARASGPRPSARRQYVDAIDENTIVFGIGPAGTGKTYLAMAKAVQALQRKEVERIILTRPAVEAGSGSASCPARSPTRSTRTCARSTTRSTR